LSVRVFLFRIHEFLNAVGEDHQCLAARPGRQSDWNQPKGAVIPQALDTAAARGLPPVEPEEATYFLGRETIIATRRPGMARWREKLFALISRNATTATAYFGIPPDRVVELGEQIEM
jgi:K+ transporter